VAAIVRIIVVARLPFDDSRALEHYRNKKHIHSIAIHYYLGFHLGISIIVVAIVILPQQLETVIALWMARMYVRACTPPLQV